MIPVTTDASNQQQNADASREIMQGLFKDLGKQAMALEAILRVVCGKVDRMESWMTTISFGMSELDLKLRNIAHNIDGTSAVDDDVGGKQPWAVPPPDDDIASARTVAMVSKKIGKNSKQVRVTGMAAAIIDKLAADPKSAADKNSKKKKASTTPTAETLKKVVKKKKPPSPPQPIETESTYSTDGSLENDVLKSSEKSDAMPTTAAEPIVNEDSSFITQVTDKPTVAESAVEHLDEKPFQSTESDTKDEVRLRAEPDSVEARDGHQKQTRGKEAADSRPDSDKSTPHSSPRDIHDPAASGAASSADSTPVYSSRESEQHEHETVSTGGDQTESDQDQARALESRSSAGATDQSLQSAAVSAEGAPVRRTRTVKKREVTAISVPTTEQLAPTTAIQSDAPLVLPDAALVEPVPSPTPLQPVLALERAEEQLPANNDESSPTISNSVETGAVPASPISTEEIRSTNKEAGRPRRSSLLGRVLVMNERKLSHKRRSSKTTAPVDIQAPPTFPDKDSPAVRHDEPKQVAQQEVSPENHNSFIVSSDGSNELKTSGSAVENDTFDGDSDSEASQDDDNNSSESPSSDSDDAEGTTEQQQYETKETSTPSAATTMLGSKRVSIAAGSTISRTMTALKKLKKANMLTPEEEEELKHRAQEKWYKLKGHVKEKQKKEVANILLKRKKNVFTVSSRLELLEEKSREVFASIKQIGNELKLKTDLTAHESLRRQVADIQRSLQNLDVRLGKIASQLTTEKVTELGKQLVTLRTGISEELVSLHQVVNSNYAQLDAQIVEQRDRLQSIEETIPEKLEAQAQEFEQKLQALPDFGSAIESTRRALRRKADLKMLKELEARLLGHTLEEEDCLVRCLSCHKEVINLQQLDKDGEDEESGSGASSNTNQLRKVNPGPSSAKIYRSNVPFSAEPTGMNSDATSNADSNLPSTSTLEESKNATPVTRRVDSVLPKASPISRLAINATSSSLSPDRPISAPAAALKKKTIATIKSRTTSATAFQNAKE